MKCPNCETQIQVGKYFDITAPERKVIELGCPNCKGELRASMTVSGIILELIDLPAGSEKKSEESKEDKMVRMNPNEEKDPHLQEPTKTLIYRPSEHKTVGKDNPSTDGS